MSVARELRKLNELRDSGASEKEIESARKKLLDKENAKPEFRRRRRVAVADDPKPFENAPLIQDKTLRYIGLGLFGIAGVFFMLFIESWALSIGLIFLLMIAGIALFSEKFW